MNKLHNIAHTSLSCVFQQRETPFDRSPSLGRLVYVPNRIQGARAGSGPRPRASRVFIGRPQFQSELTKACCTPKVALGTNESMGCGRLAALMG